MNEDLKAFETTARRGGSLVVVTFCDKPPAEAVLNAYDRVAFIGPDVERLANVPDDAERLAGAIGPGSDSLSVQRYNIPGLASAQDPTDTLEELFPGLQKRSRISAPSLSPETFRAVLDGLPQPLDLWIDAPGQERALLEHLGDAVERLTHLSVRCAVTALFRGQATEAEIDAWAHEAGLHVAAANRSDPDRPLVTWRVAPFARELARVRIELDTARTEREELQSRLDAACRDGKAKEETLEQDATKARDDLAVALRAQAMATTDVEDLRSRYRELEQTCMRQGDLLRALTARLQQAARQLQEVALDGPADDDVTH